jgi:hypothetical protein
MESVLETMKWLSVLCIVIASCTAFPAAAEVVRCPDGVFREAPCAAPGAVHVPAPRRPTCDPAHPGYAECRRTLDAYRAERNRQDERSQQQAEAEAQASRSGRAWQRVTGDCEALTTEMERADCRRKTRNDRIFNRDLRDHAEADRQTQLRAQSAAARANAEAQQRKHDAAARRIQAQQR